MAAAGRVGFGQIPERELQTILVEQMTVIQHVPSASAKTHWNPSKCAAARVKNTIPAPDAATFAADPSISSPTRTATAANTAGGHGRASAPIFDEHIAVDKPDYPM